MQQPTRNFNSPNYRYGFQGQEKDSELKGEGNSINYKYRMHDPRIGRFFAVDPLNYKFAFNSPYVFGLNMVINSSELEGLENFFRYTAESQHKDSDNKAQTAGRIAVNALVGIINTVPYALNMGDAVINEGPMGPINMINKDLNDISLVIAKDMIKSKQSGEFDNGTDYLIDRVQKKEVIQAIVQTAVSRKVFKPINAQLSSIVTKPLWTRSAIGFNPTKSQQALITQV